MHHEDLVSIFMLCFRNNWAKINKIFLFFLSFVLSPGLIVTYSKWNDVLFKWTAEFALKHHFFELFSYMFGITFEILWFLRFCLSSHHRRWLLHKNAWIPAYDGGKASWNSKAVQQTNPWVNYCGIIPLTRPLTCCLVSLRSASLGRLQKRITAAILIP